MTSVQGGRRATHYLKSLEGDAGLTSGRFAKDFVQNVGEGGFDVLQRRVL
jgi:hypothetical protein